LDYDAVKVEIVKAHQVAFAGGMGGQSGLTIRQQRLALDNLLCLVSELYYGHKEYAALHSAMVSTEDATQQATLRGELEKRSDGPHQKFVRLPAYKQYTHVAFTVLPSSGGESDCQPT
jgi:hypothetical protein